MSDDIGSGELPDAARSVLASDAIEIDTYGELQRRVADSPLRFSFTWRETKFRATVEASEDGLRLTLHNNVTSLPYSAEDKSRRQDLFAVVDTHRHDSAGKLKIVRGQEIVLDGSIELPEETGNTITDLVSTLTVLVLRAAPHLDLLAESVASLGELKPASH